ncbi:MAG: SRPBCC domain-containing protein [Sandaracinaceae bacterium]|nr:SRPBCC domain-containing protein [Sandaracinaceae bacterium]
MPQTPEETIVRSEIEIDAPAALVFSLITDLERYPRWNPFTPTAVSTLALGAPIDMKVRLLPYYTKAQREFVTELSPPRRRVAWGMHMGRAEWGRGHRTQEVVVLDEGRCRYVCEDNIGGRLRPLIIRFFGGAMQRGFDDVGRALKAEAEKMVAERRATHG